MEELTKKQDAVYQFILQSIKKNGFPPTLREIGNKFSLSLGTIQDHISLLKAKGYLKVKPNTARGYEPVSHGIPVYGKVAAGKPIFAIENIEGYVQDSYKKTEGVFALKVTGDSMIDAGILDRDVLIVHKQETAEDKDIVIALLDDEVTVKRFRRKRGKIFLEAANEKYEPIEKEFTLIGKVIESRRKY
ncbi:transcriptional repressor LexA [bacterium]|nr:transcriptional repressor LexA [bacterium]